MGGGMASNLLKHGFPVTGFDVYQPLVDKFVAAGGKAGASPKAIAQDADFIISMVATAAQNAALLFEGKDPMIDGLGQAKTFVLCSTTPPDFLHELRKRLDHHDRSDVRLLDCPVSGGTIRAADGTLSIFSSGPDADLDAAQDILDAMSGNLYRMGGISSGSKTKTIHQLLAATNIISAAEAMGLAATVGLNTTAVVDTVNGSSGASFMFSNRAPHMLQNDWHPYSALAIILKDTHIVTDTALKAQFPVPLASTAEALYLQGVRAGLLKDDDAKLVQLYLPVSQGDLVSTMTKADVMMTTSYQVSKDSIAELLAGIHLAASIEAMALCKQLGVDRKVMADIISRAAGESAMYVKCIPGMLAKDAWSLADCPEAEDVGAKLANVVDKCRKLEYPCPMAAAALEQFHFARLSTKTVAANQGRGR